MEYQKIIHLLDDTTDKPSKFRARNCAEINDELRRIYSVSNQLQLKTSMIRLNLCDYSDTYIHVERTIAVPNTGTVAALKNRNKKLIFKNYAPFTNSISEINNTRVDNTHVIMPTYNLIEYSDSYLKISGSL